MINFSKLKNRDAGVLSWSDAKISGARLLDWKDGDIAAVEINQNLLGYMGDKPTLPYQTCMLLIALD